MPDTERAGEPIEVNTIVKDSGTWAKSVGVTIPKEAVDKEFGAVAGELAGAVNLPGFRPGKVPRNVIEKRYGDDIKKQVTSNLISRGLRSAIQKEKLEVVGEPHIEIEKYKATRGEDLKFDVDVEVKPTFTLGEYKGLTIEQEEIEVLPDEIDKALDRVRDRFAEEADAPADHAVKEGDTVKGVLRTLVDGKEVHKEEDAALLVMNGHVLGANAHLGSQYLEGQKVGEKRTVEETLTGSFAVKEYVDKKATLEFEAKSIKSRVLPPADDKLAEKIGMKNIDELKEKIRSSLLEQIRSEIEKGTRENLMDKIVETTPFDLPQRLSDMMSARMTEGKLQQLAQMGMSAEMLGKNVEEFVDGAKKSSMAEIRRYFILDAIAEKENISVDEDDVDQEIVKEARQRGMKASELYDKLVESEQLRDLEHQIKTRKVLDYLVENADIKIVPRKPVEEPKHDHSAHAPGHAHEHGHEHGHQ